MVARVKWEWRHALWTCLLRTTEDAAVLSMAWPEVEGVKQFGRDVKRNMGIGREGSSVGI